MIHPFGTVLLVALTFTDASGQKKRPALVIFDDGGADLLVTPVTSHQSRSPRDMPLSHWQAAGLRLPSVVRLEKLATVSRRLVIRRMGTMMPDDVNAVRRTLALFFAEILAQE